jgi:hypothetical protein
MSALPDRSDATDRLSGQDLAFLAWESRNRPMHIAAMASFEIAGDAGIPSLDALRSLLAKRARAEPRLQSVLKKSRWRRPRWMSAQPFRIENHVFLLPEEIPGCPRREDRIDSILSSALDPRKPLWEIWLDPSGAGGRGFTLLIKIHHALIDGIAGVALVERLLGGEALRTVRSRPPTRLRTPGRISLRAAYRFLGDHFRGSPRTPFNGEVGPERHHLSFECATADFDLFASSLNATRNDLLLAQVATAMRRWLLREVDPPSSNLVGLRAFCPVSLRSKRDRALFGNRISPWFVDLPMDESTVGDRVARIHGATRALRRTGASCGGDTMARAIELLGSWVAKLGMAIAARRRAFNIVVTNVPGPRRPIRLMGGTLDSLVAFAPLFPGQRISVALVECAGRLSVGLTDGWSGRDPGRRFAQDLEDEITGVLDFV